MTAYGMMGNFEKALEIGLKAEKNTLNTSLFCAILPLADANLKQMDKANAYFKLSRYGFE